MSSLISICPARYFITAAFSLRQAIPLLLDFEPKSRPANKAADIAAINAASAMLLFEVVEDGFVEPKLVEFKFEESIFAEPIVAAT